MTGTDPAVDAARRAFDHWRSARPPKSAEVISETAAREALAPIRELHKPFHHYSPNADYACVNCSDDQGDPEPWPCDTARLIYTSEELSQ